MFFFWWRLSCKTYAEDAKLGQRRVLLLNGIHIVGQGCGRAGGRVLLKEAAQALLLLLRVGRVPVAFGFVVSATNSSLCLLLRRGIGGRGTHHSMGQGSPLNQSGMNTLYLCWSSECAKMSAP